jgi:ribosomal protein L24
MVVIMSGKEKDRDQEAEVLKVFTDTNKIIVK